MTEKHNDMYKWIMGAMQAVILMGGGVFLNTYIDGQQKLTEAQAVMSREIVALTVQVANLEKQTGNRYTAENASADRRTQAQIDAQQTQNIGRIEAMLESLIKKVDRF